MNWAMFEKEAVVSVKLDLHRAPTKKIIGVLVVCLQRMASQGHGEVKAVFLEAMLGEDKAEETMGIVCPSTLHSQALNRLRVAIRASSYHV